MKIKAFLHNEGIRVKIHEDYGKENMEVDLHEVVIIIKEDSNVIKRNEKKVYFNFDIDNINIMDDYLVEILNEEDLLHLHIV